MNQLMFGFSGVVFSPEYIALLAAGAWLTMGVLLARLIGRIPAEFAILYFAIAATGGGVALASLADDPGDTMISAVLVVFGVFPVLFVLYLLDVYPSDTPPKKPRYRLGRGEFWRLVEMRKKKNEDPRRRDDD